MRLIRGLVALSAATQCCFALAGQPADGQREQRVVYLNGNVVGVYDLCLMPNSLDVYLDETFYQNARLRRGETPVECGGKTFWKPAGIFSRNDADNTVSATAQPSDYVQDVQGAAGTDDEARIAPAYSLPPGVQTYASVFQHELGIWREPAGDVDATLGLHGQQYTPYGVFSVEGYVSSSSGQVQSYVSDASWKRDYVDAGIASRVGVNTFSSTGNTTTLYGVVLGSDDTAIQASSSQAIEGFADVPGTLQIRSNGQLVKQMPVQAGFFQISAAGLPTTPGAPGLYNLTLVDAAGRVVRSWDVFVPTSASVLRAGTSDWKIFAGQIENYAVHNSLIEGPRNLGGGFVYRHGITSMLTGEMSAIVAERTLGGGVEADFVPNGWISFNGGATKYWGDVLSSSAFAGVDLHSQHAGVYLGYTQLPCYNEYFSVTGQGGVRNVPGECKTVLTNGYVQFDQIGRFNVLRTATLGGSQHASSLGFNWALPAMGGLTLSAFGTRQYASGSTSWTVGVLANISFGRGMLTNSANASSGNSQALSTLYTVTDAQNSQYGIGADVNHAPSHTTEDLQASASYSPWFGFYQTHLIVNNNGGITAGLNETGALVYTQGQVLATKEGDQGYSILHLKGVADADVEDGMGITRAVTNRNGYAVVPAYPGGAPMLKVSSDELPDDVAIGGALIGNSPDQWSAMLFEPGVRHVNHGWVRLTRPNGEALPVGAMFMLGSTEPTYVLDGGETFISDLPVEPREVEVRLPSDTGRCVVQFPGSVKLSQNLQPDAPTYECVPPTQ